MYHQKRYYFIKDKIWWICCKFWSGFFAQFVRIINYLQTTKDDDGSNGGDNHNATDEHESIAEMSAVNDFVEDLKRNLQASSMSKKK